MGWPQEPRGRGIRLRNVDCHSVGATITISLFSLTIKDTIRASMVGKVE